MDFGRVSEKSGCIFFKKREGIQEFLKIYTVKSK